MNLTQKTPSPGEYWVSNAGDEIAYICGFDHEGDPVFLTNPEENARIDRMKEFCCEWHHEPRCTGFDWTPPAETAIDPGDGFELLPVGTVLQEGDQYSVNGGKTWTDSFAAGTVVDLRYPYRRRKPPAETWPKWYVWTDESIKIAFSRQADGGVITHGPGFEQKESDPWQITLKGMLAAGRIIEVTEAEALARVKPAEVWPKYYVRTSGADSWVYRADGRYTIRNLTCDCVADPAEWYWRHGNMVEITEAEAKSRLKPQAEPIAAERIPDNRPVRDVIMEVRDWLDPHPPALPDAAKALETIEEWLADNPEQPAADAVAWRPNAGRYELATNVTYTAVPGKPVATAEVKITPVESPDDWVEITDPEHVLRMNIDEVWHSFETIINEWQAVFPSAGMKLEDSQYSKARCRRKDLPVPQPKRTPVRLWCLKNSFQNVGSGVIACGEKPDDASEMWSEIKFDGSMFYVEG